MGIIVVGSLNYDLVTYTDRIPHAGETFRANSFETHAGGKGLNQTIAIAKLKQTDAPYAVRMVGNVGDDSFGQQLLTILKANDVNVSEINVVPGESTGVATILVEAHNGGQNRILLTEGANGRTVYTPNKLVQLFGRVLKDDIEDNKHFVVLQHEIPDPCSIMAWVKKNHSAFQIVFNPSPFHPIAKENWLFVDILIVNEIEALQIVEAVYSKEEYAEYEQTIKTDFFSAYSKLCQKFQETLVNQLNSAIVIITLGSQGVLFASKVNPKVAYVPSIANIEVVDTTGAGDTFLGSLVTQLYQDAPLDKAIKFATKASSITIQRRGAAESIPSYMEVNLRP